MAPNLPFLDIGAPPRTIGPYEVLEHLGRGRTADAFVARAPADGGTKKIVLKRLRDDLREEPHFLDAFAHQAELLLRLRHPNVVETLEARAGGDDGVTVVEHLDGHLLSRIRERPQAVTAIPLAIHLRILSHVLGALHYLHETNEPEAPDGIVHGDVRPDKIFVTFGGEVKLLHSGIAGAAEDTGTGILKERLSYMAPEHARGEAVDRRSDIFSVGVMLWEAITGLRFWQDWHELAIYRRLCSENLPLRPPWIPIAARELFEITDRALAGLPDQRYETAREMQDAIETILARPGNRASTGDIRSFMQGAFGAPRPPLESSDDAPTVARILDHEIAAPSSESPGTDSISPMATATAPVRPAAHSNAPRAALLVLGTALFVMGALMLVKVVAQETSPPRATVSATLVAREPDDASRELAVPTASVAIEPPAEAKPAASSRANAAKDENVGAPPAKPPRPRRVLARDDPWGI